MTDLITPHGGRLVDRWLKGRDRERALSHLEGRPGIQLDAWSLADLELMGTGVFSPLTGFMGKQTYDAVVDHMRLPSGLVWPMPITLAISRAQAGRLRQEIGKDVALLDAAGNTVGLLELAEIFEYDKLREARDVFKAYTGNHPGVSRLLTQGEMYAGGEVWYLADPAPEFPDLYLTPVEARAAFKQRGWETVVGFQTRNPVHRAHEYMQKCALEMVDGLFLNPLVGQTKADDIPAAIRVRSYRELLDIYYPAERVMLAAFPAAMRYAGPREAVLHAICRQNYGCSHFIVGRDHAGVGNFYGTYDAQNLLKELRGELAITPICFDHTFYCKTCANMASEKTCPHGSDHHVHLSGTKVREMLRSGELPPPEFSRPEVAAILAEGLRGLATAVR
jgi:sulfate adenylyltransferase